MKKYKNVIIYTCIFVLFMALAVFGYSYLKQKYPEGEVQENNNEEILVKATDFKMLSTDGKKVKLSDYFGKPIIVNSVLGMMREETLESYIQKLIK